MNITPEKLKRMDESQLTELAEQIRAFLVESVAATGGHLAPNLGIVEITLALHRVFDSPCDQFVWDVGHQSYVHKMVTGRWDRFDTLRNYGGLCGFPLRTESEHDCFGTGHSSTSLSAAMGLCYAMKSRGETNHVVAIIGDGALTGGMAYEALNNIGSAKVPLIIVLNDNGMSISRNVGALHFHLSKIRSGARYIGMKKSIAKRWPRLARTLERIKNSIKYMVLPSAFFEELGIKYLGPIDGHDLREVETVLKKAKNFDVPVLIHAVTQKGKGYTFAEENPEKFHGIAPFLIETGDVFSVAQISNSSVFGQKLCALAKERPEIVAVTAAMPQGTGLDLFASQFPQRFFDVGIAEPHAVTFGAGLAAGGLRPVVAVYSTFLQRAYDQILHDVCLQNLPVTFAVDRCGPVGEDGATHHGAYDIGYLTQMPNMSVLSPATQEELREMLAAAVAHMGPSAVRYPRSVLPSVPLKNPVEWGKWEVITSVEAVNIVATGSLVAVAQKVTEKLTRLGLRVGLVNARFLKPLDEQMLERLASCERLFVMEDGVLTGGLGEHIARFAAQSSRVRLRCFGLPEKPLTHGRLSVLWEEAGLSVDSLYREMLAEIRGENAQQKKA